MTLDPFYPNLLIFNRTQDLKTELDGDFVKLNPSPIWISIKETCGEIRFEILCFFLFFVNKKQPPRSYFIRNV